MKNKSGYNGGGSIIRPRQEQFQKFAETKEMKSIAGPIAYYSNTKRRPTNREIQQFIFSILKNHSKKIAAPEIPTFFDDGIIGKIKAYDNLFNWAIKQGDNFEKASNAFINHETGRQTLRKKSRKERRRDRKKSKNGKKNKLS